MNKLSPITAVFALVLSGTPIRAASTSITQVLTDPNSVYTTTFTLASFSDVTIQTWGYAGGTNANGTVIPAGGFDPAVALFQGTGSAATIYDFDDDGSCPPGNVDAVSGQCLDSTLVEIALAPGTYTLVLMASPNAPVGPTLGDGFAGGGSFTDFLGNVRTGNFAVNITITASLQAQVITFGTLNNSGLGTGSIALSATSSSGLAVAFASNTTSVCTVSGVNVALVGLGTCSITASQAGNATYAAAASVTQTFLIYTPPSVTIESPPPNATLSASVGISGWALENTSVVGPNAISSVTVSVDGFQVGTANYGVSRTDVCTTYPGRLGCPNVGWNYSLDLSPFGPGSHNLSVVATDSGGNPGFSQVTFNKVQPLVNIDTPTAGAGLAGVVGISGWALEATSSAGANAVSSVTVLVDGNQVGTATYGALRADVCAVYTGGQGCPNVGWNYNLDVTSLAEGAHWLHIVATDTANNVGSSQSAFNSVVQTSATPQTITFGALTNVALGAAPFTISATASSGLTVSFSSSIPAVCTVSGNTVIVAGVGTCSIVASQTGDATHAAAASVLQSFTVSQGTQTQTITFGLLGNVAAGAPPFTITATASSRLSVIFFSTTTAVCTVEGTMVTPAAAGICTIQATQPGNTTYAAATPVYQSFQVTAGQASQTIAFGALSNQQFGATPFTVSATATSGLAVSFNSQTPAVCTVSGATVTLVAVGTCTIQATQAGNANYAAATPVNQSFQVTQETQSIIFGTLPAQTLGATPFTVSATATSGLAVSFNSQTPAVCTVSGATVTLVAVGTCTIQATQAGNANYAAATPVSQSFQVTLTQSGQTLLTSLVPVAAPTNSGPLVLSANGSGIPNGAVIQWTTPGGTPVNLPAFFNNSAQIESTLSNTLLTTAGTAQVAILSPGGGLTGSLPFNIVTPGANWPVLTSLSPNSAPYDSAFTVTANGSSFQSGDSLWWAPPGGLALVLPATFVNGAQLQASVPANLVSSPGMAQVAVLTPGNGASAPVSFLYSNTLDQPVLISLSPTSAGLDTPAFTLTATGSGFQSGTSIWWTAPTGAAINLPATLIGSTQVQASIPAVLTTTAGSAQVAILNPGFGLSTAQAFPITIPSGPNTPVLTSLSPNSIPLDAAFTVTANGSAFQSGASLWWAPPGGVAVELPATFINSAQLQASVPANLAGTPGMAQVAVLNPGSAESTTVPFVYSNTQDQPTVISLSPSFAGLDSPTFTLTANGSGFQSGASIWWTAPTGGAINLPATFIGSAQVQASIPAILATTAGTAQVAVLNPYFGLSTAQGFPIAIPNGLQISKTHGGNFAQGQTNAIYTVIVSNNVDAVPTSGTVTVTELVPTGLTLVSMMGNLWTCPPGGTTCARSDVLSGGASYPPITVTVNVAGSAPASVTNQVILSEGGSAVGYATDSTNINAVSSQTITFGALSNQQFGAAPFTVSATATSGLAVSFNSQTPAACTVSGATVTLVAVGTCTIQATQAGNTSYAAATPVNQSFQVTQETQSIIFGTLLAQTLGATPFTVSATATSGLAVSFNSQTPAVCTVSGATVTLVAVGTCTIQATQAGNTNWSAAPSVNQNFTVTQGSQTINFGSLQNQAFGTAPFTVSATATSRLTVSFTSLTVPVCTVSGSTVTLVTVGTCTIQATQAGNTSYAAAPSVNQSFQVAQEIQSIIFGTLPAQTFGAAPFTVSATATSGLAVSFNSQTPAVCTVSGSTVTLVSGGTCTIQATQAGNANYAAATPASQSFQVTISLCDLKQNGSLNMADVQLIINEALGVMKPVNDLSRHGVVNVSDVQIEINAAMGLGCTAK